METHPETPETYLRILPLESIITTGGFEINAAGIYLMYSTAENWRQTPYAPYNTSLKVKSTHRLREILGLPEPADSEPLLQFHMHYDARKRTTIINAGADRQTPVAYVEQSGRKVNPEMLEAAGRAVRGYLKAIKFREFHDIFQKLTHEQAGIKDEPSPQPRQQAAQ